MTVSTVLNRYNYDLPAAQVARFPLAKRQDSRLLCLNPNRIDSSIRSLGSHLRKGDLLVLNNTKVMSSRCFAYRKSGGKVELLICELMDERRVTLMAKPSRRLRVGEVLSVPGTGFQVVLDSYLDEGVWEAACVPNAKDLMARSGQIPIPPYFQREATNEDAVRYQTVYASSSGAVAAPTAGLHFTQDLLQELEVQGIDHAFVTLHVGIGTFRNLRESNLVSGELHSERYVLDQINAEKIRETKKHGGRIIAVGTTTTRCLESIALQHGEIIAENSTTRLFIRDSFRFQVIDGLLTNFHLPMSSLLMLVCAFGGHEPVMSAYRHAVESGYRFYSYGDAMLITPNN